MESWSGARLSGPCGNQISQYRRNSFSNEGCSGILPALSGTTDSNRERKLPLVELLRPSEVPPYFLQIFPPLLESAVFVQPERTITALTVWSTCYFAGVQKHKASSCREVKPGQKWVRFADGLWEHQKNRWDDVYWRTIVMCVVLYDLLLHKYSLISQMAYGEQR